MAMALSALASIDAAPVPLPLKYWVEPRARLSISSIRVSCPSTRVVRSVMSVSWSSARLPRSAISVSWSSARLPRSAISSSWPSTRVVKLLILVSLPVTRVVRLVTLVLVACNWLKLTASLSASPAATFMIRRLRVSLPTDTVLFSEVTLPAPSATEPSCVALAPEPAAIASIPLASATPVPLPLK